MDACAVGRVFTMGILFGFLESEPRHFFLRLAFGSGIQFFFGEEIIQVYVSDHRCLQKISLTVIAVGVIPYVHVPRNAHQYRVDVDGAEQGGEQYAAVHAVDLRRSQSVFQRPYALGLDYVARQAAV